MPRQYYPLWFRLDTEDRFLIWYSNVSDGVLVDAAERVLTFGDASAVKEFSERELLPLSEEPPGRYDLDAVVYDLDAVTRWTAAPRAEDLDASGFLNAWNLFTDVAASTNQEFEPADVAGVFEKLFWANNLPAVTPPGEKFTPEWSPGELALLANVLKEGLRMFRLAVERPSRGADS